MVIGADAAGTTTERAERIGRAVDGLRDELVGFLQELVRVPSQTGHEGAVQAVVADRMRADGLAVDVWEPELAALAPYAEHVTTVDSYANRPNVVGRFAGAGVGRSLILNAHIDTVEPGDERQWSRPPFSGEVVDGRLYGRGACDMKAGLVTHLFALAALRAAGFAPLGDVVVQSVISEEDGGAGALAAVLRGGPADAAIITEPTKLAVIAAQGGSLMFRLRVPGRSAHAAVRDEGVSAIEKFALLHGALLDFEARRNGAIDHPLYAPIANKVPINVGVIRGGSWPSSVPEWLEAEGRAGLVPGEDLAGFREEFRAELERTAADDDWLRANPPTVEWIDGQFAPAEVPATAPLVVALRAAHAAVTGGAPPVEAATYGADMRHFVLVGQTPCVMYGAGDVKLAHRADESVPIDEVLTATKVVALTIADWCGVRTAD
ncbi:MAG: ArgE/DapE family deacylase [Chloroflexota bacterium]|nr:ArgE/DapE family deacylase [Chloroflexota bacterium]